MNTFPGISDPVADAINRGAFIDRSTFDAEKARTAVQWSATIGGGATVHFGTLGGSVVLLVEPPDDGLGLVYFPDGAPG